MPPPPSLPRSVLYSIMARVGGTGLDLDAHQTVKALWPAGMLGRAVAFDNRQRDVPGEKIRSLRWHPVRLLSFLPSREYYGAKRQTVDAVAAGMLASGAYDLFHGWQGESLLSLRAARRLGIPVVLEIPTIHVHNHEPRPRLTEAYFAEERRRMFPGNPWLRWRAGLPGNEARIQEEYDLADAIVVLSHNARETFIHQGFAPDKLCLVPRGADLEKFRPAPAPPEVFRALFVGALIGRKGVPELLEAWSRLDLPPDKAELWLVGRVHDEVRPAIERFAGPSVKFLGFDPNPEKFYPQASAFVFPSHSEGSAKVTFEAAASGLPIIMTRESSDAIVDGEGGVLVRPGDVDGLAAALRQFYDNPALRLELGRQARARIERDFTWGHFRERLFDAYATAMRRARERAGA